MLNQEQNDPRLIPHISANTYLQRKRVIFATVV